VGSKNFSESILLGEIVAQTIEKRAGLAVERRAGLGGTFVCHQGLVRGDLDVYVEYTGTALVAILKDERRMTDPARVREEVARAWRERFAAEWTAPLGFDDTFALLVRKADAERHALSRISDLAGKPLRPGFGYEFVARPDGYQAFVEAYGIAFPSEPVTMELDLTYRALAEGKVDVIAGNSTDGRIEKLGLVQLTDDRRFFPPYEAAPIVRTATLSRHPRVADALAALGGKIDVATMRRLNAAVDVDRRPVADVAREFVART
jgi:glycine betaine/choline ABC-type transport system substrate-binding protein